MKLGIFTDPHYSSQEITCGRRYNSRSLAKMKAALADFRAAGCERVVCLGDLIDREDSHKKEQKNLRAVAALLDAANIPVWVLRGNHDGFCFTEPEFYEILGEDRRPKDLVYAGGEILFLDACFYGSGAPYDPAASHDWTDTCLPHPEALAERLAVGSGEVCIFLHQNIDPNIREDHCLHNAAEVRSILEKSGRVKRVFQGHYHRGAENVHNGIRYTTFPAMCEHEDGAFLVEL